MTGKLDVQVSFRTDVWETQEVLGGVNLPNTLNMLGLQCGVSQEEATDTLTSKLFWQQVQL